MVDDREGTALSVSAGFVWDDLPREVDLDLGSVTVTGSHFPEADDWVLLFHRLNFLFGAAGSPGPGLVVLWDGEDVGLVRIGKSDATVG